MAFYVVDNTTLKAECRFAGRSFDSAS